MKHLILFLAFVGLLPYELFAQENKELTDTIIYGSVQKNFRGGQDAYNKYLADNTHYPLVARQNNIQGCALIRFIIEKDSSLSNIRLYSGVGSGIDDEAIKTIRESGKWIPSQVAGTSVRTRCIVPVQFILEAGNDDKLKGGVNGYMRDSSYLSAITRIESLGIPVSEAPGYVNKTIPFIGKIYGTKAISDTVFVITCGDIPYNTPVKYINLVLVGKDVLVKVPKADLLNACLITGTGTVVSYQGTYIIIINDKKQYRILAASSDPYNFRRH